MKFKILASIIAMCSILMITPKVLAEGAIDASDANGIYTIPGSTTSCSNTSNSTCWETYISGIRVAIVDENGNLISSRSHDFIFNVKPSGDINYVNKWLWDNVYYRCINNDRTKLYYIDGGDCGLRSVGKPWVPGGWNEGWCHVPSQCNSNDHSFYTKVPSDTLENVTSIFNGTSAKDIENALKGMTIEKLKAHIFNVLGYDFDAHKENIENHYIIVEPIGYVRSPQTYNFYSSQWYYGTYTELVNAIGIHRQKAINAINALALAIYSTGNDKIGGYGGFDENGRTYFKGKLTAVDPNIMIDGNKVSDAEYLKRQYAFGIGIFWMKDVIDGPSDGGPSDVVTCDFNLDIKNPTCSDGISYSHINDMYMNWDCVYASAYSSNSDIKEYFLEYEDPNGECSVYCKHEFSYQYPGNSMITLAGSYFTIADSTAPYGYSLDEENKLNKLKAATLGPVRVHITKRCGIYGDNPNNCKEKAREIVQDVEAPVITFKYDTEYDKYKDNEVTLTPIIDEAYGAYRESEDIWYTKEVEYSYKLPNNTYYRYIDKITGISYKNLSSIGINPYIDLGSHSPIHTVFTNNTPSYTLTIKDFGIDNFNNYVLNGKQIPTNFTVSVETYASSLFEDYPNISTPDFITKFNKKYIYDIDNLMATDCARAYGCYNNNGIYCTNNAEFVACIQKKADELQNNSESQSYKTDMKYSCTFKIEKNTGDPNCPGDPSCPSDTDDSDDNKFGIDVIYRPISLDDPFPSIDGDGRITGANWCYGTDCNNTNEVVKNVITNNRGVTTEEIYHELDPLYTITLTPGLIKEIRDYNDNTTYDDFNLECTNGRNCKSTFIRDNFKSYFKGCGINTIGLDCNESDKW